MSPKRYYTFMLEQEMIDALKAAKDQTDLSEGAVIRQALKEWFKAHGIAMEKSPRTRVAPRKRG